METIKLNDNELLFLSECLLGYQAVLVEMQKKAFGETSHALEQQINEIAELNYKILRKD